MNLEAPNRMDRRPRTTALLASLTDDLREIRRTAKKRLSLITHRSSVDMERKQNSPRRLDGDDEDTIQLLDEPSERSQSTSRDCGVDDYYLEQLRRRSLRDSPVKKTPKRNVRHCNTGNDSSRNLFARRSSCGASTSSKPKVTIFNISYDYLADDSLKVPQRDPNSSLCSLTLAESFSTFQNDSFSSFHNESFSTFTDSLRVNDDSHRMNNDSFRMNEDAFDWASTGGLSQDHADNGKECFFVVNNDSWTAEKEGVPSVLPNESQIIDVQDESQVPLQPELDNAEKAADDFNEEDAEEWQTKFQALGEEYQKLWEHCQGLVSEINKKNQLLRNQDDRTLTRKEMKRQLYWYALENVLLRKRLAIQEQEQKLLRSRLQRHKDADAERSKINN